MVGAAVVLEDEELHRCRRTHPTRGTRELSRRGRILVCDGDRPPPLRPSDRRRRPGSEKSEGLTERPCHLLARMASSVQRAGRQYEAKRRTRRGRVAAVHPRAVKPAAAGRGHGCVGRAVVCGDPVHDRGEVGAFGEDRGSLDHDPARSVRARESRYECVDLEVLHGLHGTR
jgi:hypothetical protein